MKNFKKHLSIPNLLSLYRLLSFPLILYLIFSQQEKLFVVLLIVNLVTDILDGFIARTFNMTTEFGARLDSLADIGMYISALTGVIVFKATDFEPYLVSLGIFIAFFFLPQLVSFVKFRSMPSLHLYSSKVSTLLQGLFFLFLFTAGFNTLFYYIVIAWGILSYLEQIVVLILASEPKANARGLYWVLKERPRVRK
jgi:CDP-diacylglycerol--glycerol-3-phosphate 3-phosphatidyltransferase